MNYLALCQRAHKLMGISGIGPVSTANQSGELGRVVDWVADAYNEICAEYNNWKFLRSRFFVPTVIGQQAYLPSSGTDTKSSTAITADSFGEWIFEPRDTFRIYLTSAGEASQQNIWPTTYNDFRFRYQMQAVGGQKPGEFAIREDDNAILLGPTPDALYTVVGEYYRRAPVLSGDSAVPLFPERFHMAIVWRAVRSYALYEEAGGVYSGADREYKRLHGPLLIDQLPRIGLSGPLA